MIKRWIRQWIRKIVNEEIDRRIGANKKEIEQEMAQPLASIRATPKGIIILPKGHPIPAFKNDPDASRIAALASKVGIAVIKYDPKQLLLRFGDPSCFIDVWYTTMTVATNIKHPVKGWNRLYRKHVSMVELEKIFRNPREHTGKGYREK